MLNSHFQRVEKVRSQILNRGNAKIALSTRGRVGHCVRTNSWKNNCWLIDVSQLNHILSIDEENLRCIIEPGITFDNLCQHLLPLGLLPLVIPEFKNITVGGAIQGLGVESSSFKYGLFEDSVISVDVVVGNGEIIQATSSSSSDLFFAMFGSYGTMGVLVKVEIQLMRAMPNLKITYTPIFGDNVLNKIAGGHHWWCVKKDQNGGNVGYDFCEAILYRENYAVLIRASFEAYINGDSSGIKNFVRKTLGSIALWWKDPSHWRFWWGRWFYQHAGNNENCSSSEEWSEVVPTLDYLFRHDRGIFWCAEVRGVGTSLFERLINGWYWSSANAYKAEHLSNVNNDFHRIVQDIAIPLSKQRLKRFLKMLDTSLKVYPLWLCPIQNICRHSSQKIFSLPTKHDDEEWYVNVGIYGAPTSWNGRPFHLSYITAHRALENTTQRLRGRKGLYSTSYYTRDEFNQEYDVIKAHYIRQKYKLDKCVVDIFTKCVEDFI